MFRATEAIPNVVDYEEALSWTLRNIGRQNPLYPVEMANRKALMISPRYLERGFRNPKHGLADANEMSNMAVFISARTDDGAREVMRREIGGAGMTAVEAVFSLDLIRFNRLNDMWLAGLSFARLLASDAIMFRENVGIFGLAELTFAKMLNIPLITAGADYQEIEKWCMGKLGRAGINQLEDVRSIWECVMKNRNWLDEITHGASRHAINRTKLTTQNDLTSNTFRGLIDFYLSNPDLRLDWCRQWTLKRLGLVDTKLAN
ncbi:MAG: hypothetical protein UU09_C0011G0035 [Microgenomates group bacterium GW2011_GWA2_40_6]|nr:MAG: hypothetical protein UU09_C0011G0035 [Microgenomates group bacterium GW2011_GWA2_40_6]